MQQQTSPHPRLGKENISTKSWALQAREKNPTQKVETKKKRQDKRKKCRDRKQDRYLLQHCGFRQKGPSQNLSEVEEKKDEGERDVFNFRQKPSKRPQREKEGSFSKANQPQETTCVIG